MHDPNFVAKMREKYRDVHPLVFHRSLERARSAVEMFDILDTIPPVPFSWSDQEHRWVTAEDVYSVDYDVK